VSQQAIAPLGECKSNVDLFRELAQRMGFDDSCFSETVDEMIDIALSSGASQLAGITRERLEREPQVRLNLNGDDSDQPWLPFARGFATPTGKARLYDADLIALGMDPVADFVPPDESRHTAHAARFPLELLARKADNFLNSTFVNLPTVQKMERPPELEMNRRDAESRGIQDGDRVRVFNHRGEIVLTARVDGVVSPGVVGAKLGWAKLTDGGVNINVLTSARLADMGGGATFYSTLVEVERILETSAS
ncbi:MAG TPA: molybdopterin dinucleotide binding domain-containing protein, partial [Candidatus Angelobacter sp.]|nr:molybdopterin dinucleotide binding domain-containing protein [Candidatus Angelobacter sp.]